MTWKTFLGKQRSRVGQGASVSNLEQSCWTNKIESSQSANSWKASADQTISSTLNLEVLSLTLVPIDLVPIERFQIATKVWLFSLKFGFKAWTKAIVRSEHFWLEIISLPIWCGTQCAGRSEWPTDGIGAAVWWNSGFVYRNWLNMKQ